MGDNTKYDENVPTSETHHSGWRNVGARAGFLVSSYFIYIVVYVLKCMILLHDLGCICKLRSMCKRGGHLLDLRWLITPG